MSSASGAAGDDSWSEGGLSEDLVQTVEHGGQFGIGEDACGGDGAGVGLRGGDLLREETPVKGERALPLFEGLVEWLAEAAGPHLGGLLLTLFMVI